MFNFISRSCVKYMVYIYFVKFVRLYFIMLFYLNFIWIIINFFGFVLMIIVFNFFYFLDVRGYFWIVLIFLRIRVLFIDIEKILCFKVIY